MFESVQMAVGLSLKHNKPLLVVISSANNPQDSCWAHSLVSQTLQSAGNFGSIALAITQGSADYKNFTDLFPVKAVPCIYLLNKSDIIFKVEEPIDSPSLIKLLSEAAATSPAAQTTSSPASAHEKEKESNNKNNNKNKNKGKAKNKDQVASKSSSSDPSGSPNSVREHSREVFLQKKKDSEERKRILRLVQNDREELRIRAERERAKLNSTTPPPDPKVASKESSQETAAGDHSQCALLIRLFNGTGLKHRFQSTDTLGTVRKWVEENRSDSKEPFTFFQNIPKRWFEATDEEKTLKELGLAPSASLILKAVSNIANAYPTQPSWFSLRGAADAAYTFLGIGYRPVPREDFEESDVPDISTPISSRSSTATRASSEEPADATEPWAELRMRTHLSVSPADDSSN